MTLKCSGSWGKVAKQEEAGLGLSPDPAPLPLSDRAPAAQPARSSGSQARPVFSRSLSPGLHWSAPAEPWASTPADWLPGEACRPHVNNHRLPITAVQGRADDGPAGLTGDWRGVEATGPAVGTRPG